MILEETYNFLKNNYPGLLKDLTIEEARLGYHLSAVRLSDNSYGTAGTLPENDYHCTREKRDFGDFTPTKIAGQSVSSLFETAKRSAVIDTLRIAVLNAISSTVLKNGDYNIVEDTDPIDLIDLSPAITITIVGAFHSYIGKISAAGSRLFVLELNKEALTEETKKFYVPAEDYKNVIPQSDVVIITGLTLVNNTIDGLLSAVTPGTTVIVTGPSSSIIPDILFENKVSIIGATRILHPDLLFQIVSEFGAGFHLFRYCAQKICILKK